MNRQRKVVITVTYNDLGTIIDTKAEELDSSAQSNLQPTCNQLATDLISRADVEQTVEDNILCYTHSDRPIDQDPDMECHMAIRTALRMLKKDLRKLPSVQPVAKDINVPTNDYISKQAAIDLWEQYHPYIAIKACEYDAKLRRLPSVQPEQRWIPFNTRSLTEEEKEDNPEWDCILDCKLPDDGQAILVSINVRGHERVQYDEFITDDGSYLDSGYEIGTEATAWMPLPEPYKGGEQDGSD